MVDKLRYLGMASIYHDAVECNSGFSESKDKLEVFRISGMVQMD